MATAAPLLQEPVAPDDAAPGAIEPEPVDPAVLEQEIAEQNRVLANAPELPESVRLFIEELADDVATLPIEATLRTDPYLLVALQKSLLAALRALQSSDARVARRELRIRLEQIRQVYRDLADSRPMFEDRPAKDLVRWLSDVIDVPHARLAELFEVSPRTFQRWVSESDPSEPGGDEARRVHLVANLVAHLRHALTGQGVLQWFERPHPLVGGRSPRALLDEPDALPRLTRLAASTRSALSA